MTYEDFKLHIKYRLGYPLIQIELTDQQIDLGLNEAIKFYQLNHYNGSEQVYMPIQITEQIKSNRYVDLGHDVIGVNSIFDVGSNSSLLSIDFMMTADAAWSAFRSGGGLASYYSMMSYRSLIQQTFASKVPIRFNWNSGKAYIDMSDSRFVVGSWIVLDATMAIDPTANPRLFEDPFMNDYAEACVKRIWGQSLKKYNGVLLPGGITLDGKTMYDEAVEAKQKLEDEIISNWQLPIMPLVG